ncbi:ROK family protein [Hydrogenoanaerobacterium sp.]|uniref:ROK family protein n=1 Tax=Hydrogenoanaerobacterium sp. TaxID=2953763 RepID=UPI00289A000F|nr:ROK family protein [Hydrogenoanaerobacterium sp.]
MKVSIGIDIGGTKCATVLGNMDACDSIDSLILDKISFATEGSPKAVIAKLIESTDDLLQKHRISREMLHSIGISCGGPLDSKKGVILGPPNLPGWDEVAICAEFEAHYHIPVRLENDANACAVAEWKFGAARGYRNVVFLTCGTGLGAGLILDGRLYSGTNDMAGEVGHVRLTQAGPVGYGKAGSFEGLCSGGGIAQLAKMRILEKLQAGEKPELCPSMAALDDITTKDVAIAANAGDEFAKSILAESARYLGMGLSILIDILNPEVIVLGSVYQRNAAMMYPYVQEVVEREALPLSHQVCRILPAELGDRVGDCAALALTLLEE